MQQAILHSGTLDPAKIDVTGAGPNIRISTQPIICLAILTVMPIEKAASRNSVPGLPRCGQYTSKSRIRACKEEGKGTLGRGLGIEFLLVRVEDLFETSSDSESMTIVLARRPRRVLFFEELSLPRAVTGPQERAPLAREAWI